MNSSHAIVIMIIVVVFLVIVNIIAWSMTKCANIGGGSDKSLELYVISISKDCAALKLWQHTHICETRNWYHYIYIYIYSYRMVKDRELQSQLRLPTTSTEIISWMCQGTPVIRPYGIRPEASEYIQEPQFTRDDLTLTEIPRTSN